MMEGPITEKEASDIANAVADYVCQKTVPEDGRTEMALVARAVTLRSGEFSQYLVNVANAIDWFAECQGFEPRRKSILEAAE